MINGRQESHITAAKDNVQIAVCTFCCLLLLVTGKTQLGQTYFGH